MTTDMVREWCRIGGDEISRSGDSPGVQSADEIQRDLDQRVAALNVVAERVYTIWAEGLML
jgi:hypothetical protein